MTKPIIDSADISALFARYRDDVDRMNMLQNRLFERQDRDSWLNCYKERSRVIREAFEHNGELTALLNSLCESPSDIPAGQFESLYNEFINLDVSKYDDPFLAVKCADMLIRHYLPSEDLTHLLPLYNRLGWETTATFRMGCEKNAAVAMNAYKSILAYRDRYATFEDPKLRRIIFVAYCNIITVMPSFDNPVITVDESADYLRELIEFYHSDTVMSIDRDNSVIRDIFHYTQDKWLCGDIDIRNASRETRALFCQLASAIYKKTFEQSGGDIFAMSADVIAAYRQSLILGGKCSVHETIEFLYNYYNERKALNANKPRNAEFEIDEDFYFESRIPLEILRLFDDEYDQDDDFRDNIISELIASKNKYFTELMKTTTSYSPYINATLAEWYFTVLHYVDDIEEKENILFNNIVNRQMSTFFHSHMVEILAGMFTDSILRNRPDLMVPVVEARSVANIADLADNIRDYVRKAALLHDIGKNKITDIINTQERRLTDEEFDVIKRHPTIGADLIDEDFVLYYDVIKGHHRTYDCKGGYPSDFDPSCSNVKVIVDLISICDSLDAATDSLGRNYSVRKDLPTVLKELQDGAGTRYNPELVQLITDDTELYGQLNDFIENGRERLYYSLFSEHFMDR